MEDIIGIFDADTATKGEATKEFLRKCESEKTLMYDAAKLPKAFVICRKKEATVTFFSPLAAETLTKRWQQTAKLFNTQKML